MFYGSYNLAQCFESGSFSCRNGDSPGTPSRFTTDPVLGGGITPFSYLSSNIKYSDSWEENIGMGTCQ